MEIEWAGEELVLLPERAVFRPATGALLVADVHLGKTAAFRAAGIPTPEGGTTTDLERLSRAMERMSPRRLVILGDLLHARSGRTDEMRDEVTAWREQHEELPIVLVRGNHDQRARRAGNHRSRRRRASCRCRSLRDHRSERRPARRRPRDGRHDT